MLKVSLEQLKLTRLTSRLRQLASQQGTKLHGKENIKRNISLSLLPAMVTLNGKQSKAGVMLEYESCAWFESWG